MNWFVYYALFVHYPLIGAGCWFVMEIAHVRTV